MAGSRALQPGEHGEITSWRIRRAGSRAWVKAEGARRVGDRFRARARFRRWDGTYGDVSRRADRREDAERLVREALDEVLRDSPNAMSASMPFVDAGRQWLMWINRPESGLASGTLALYEYAFDHYIDVAGSTMRGATLAQANSPQRLRSFLTLIADTHGTASQKMARTVISGILNLAISNGVLDTNGTTPLRAIKSSHPRETAHEVRRSLSVAEQQHLVEVADERAALDGLNPRTRRKLQAVADLIAYMLGTGTRINEARTLRWEHVDLATGRVHVHGTKTRTSRRGLNLPTSLIERLSARAERRGVAGYVFSAPALLDAPETLWDTRQLTREIRALLDEAGFTWATSHTFRRTVATRLDERGARARDIADQLGHAQIRTTIDHYLARDFDGDKTHIAEMLD